MDRKPFVFLYYDSPLGKMIMKSHDGKSLCELSFEGQKYFNKKEEFMRISENESDKFSDFQKSKCTEKEIPVFAETKKWLDIYFSGKQPQFFPKLDLQGSEFRLAVWEILLKIPYGQTITYGDIASEIGERRGIKKMAAQAVGGAVGHNPVAIIVPCHRVIGANGSLTGYGGGIERKEKLLQLEGITITKF